MFTMGNPTSSQSPKNVLIRLIVHFQSPTSVSVCLNGFLSLQAPAAGNSEREKLFRSWRENLLGHVFCVVFMKKWYLIHYLVFTVKCDRRSPHQRAAQYAVFVKNMYKCKKRRLIYLRFLYQRVSSKTGSEQK